MGICYAKAVTDIDGFIYYTPSDLAMRKLCSAKSNSSLDKYSAIFIPGGYGCMINLPRSKALGKLLHMAQELELPTITLSHGPSVLLSTAQVNGKGFAYRDYEVNCFTDKSDKAALSSGYLPGRLPWKCQEKIEKQGIKVQNYSEIGAVHRDRELITGDSPNAANKLGIFAAQIIEEQIATHLSNTFV
jgi:molecular chaperone Hsp31 and glyoxalase 3